MRKTITDFVPLQQALLYDAMVSYRVEDDIDRLQTAHNVQYPFFTPHHDIISHEDVQTLSQKPRMRDHNKASYWYKKPRSDDDGHLAHINDLSYSARRSLPSVAEISIYFNDDICTFSLKLNSVVIYRAPETEHASKGIPAAHFTVTRRPRVSLWIIRRPTDNHSTAATHQTTHQTTHQRTTSKLSQLYRIPKYTSKDQANPKPSPQLASQAQSSFDIPTAMQDCGAVMRQHRAIMRDFRDEHHEHGYDPSCAHDSTRRRAHSVDNYKPEVTHVAKGSLSADLRKTVEDRFIVKAQAHLKNHDVQELTNRDIIAAYHESMHTQPSHCGNTGVVSENQIKSFHFHLRYEKQWFLSLKRIERLVHRKLKVVSTDLISTPKTVSVWHDDELDGDAQDLDALPKRNVKPDKEPQEAWTPEDKQADRDDQREQHAIARAWTQPPKSNSENTVRIYMRRVLHLAADERSMRSSATPAVSPIKQFRTSTVWCHHTPSLLFPG
jgi:hypothetical protein